MTSLAWCQACHGSTTNRVRLGDRTSENGPGQGREEAVEIPLGPPRRGQSQRISGAKMRVYEIAKEVGIANKDLIAKIRALGLEVNNHMSSLDADDVARIAGPSRRRSRRAPRRSRPSGCRQAQSCAAGPPAIAMATVAVRYRRPRRCVLPSPRSPPRLRPRPPPRCAGASKTRPRDPQRPSRPAPARRRDPRSRGRSPRGAPRSGHAGARARGASPSDRGRGRAGNASSGPSARTPSATIMRWPPRS